MLAGLDEAEAAEVVHALRVQLADLDVTSLRLTTDPSAAARQRQR